MPLPPYPVEVPTSTVSSTPQDSPRSTRSAPDSATPVSPESSAPRLPEWVGILIIVLAVLTAIGIGLLRPRTTPTPIAEGEPIPVASATPTAIRFPDGYTPLPAALLGGWTPAARDLPLNAGWPYQVLGLREGNHCLIAYITDPAAPTDQVAHVWVDCTAIGEPMATSTPMPPTPVPYVPPPVVAPVAPAAICKEVVLDSVVIGTACGRTQEELLADAQMVVDMYTHAQATQIMTLVTPTIPPLTTEQYEALIYGPQRATATAAALQRTAQAQP